MALGEVLGTWGAPEIQGLIVGGLLELGESGRVITTTKPEWGEWRWHIGCVWSGRPLTRSRDRMTPLPFDPAEFIGTEEARRRAGVAQRTIREWCALHRIGRRIAGRWRVSQVALDMLLSEDRNALEAYHAGDRTSDHVRRYFARRNIVLPSKPTSVAAATVSAVSSDYASAISGLM